MQKHCRKYMNIFCQSFHLRTHLISFQNCWNNLQCPVALNSELKQDDGRGENNKKTNKKPQHVLLTFFSFISSLVFLQYLKIFWLPENPQVICVYLCWSIQYCSKVIVNCCDLVKTAFFFFLLLKKNRILISGCLIGGYIIAFISLILYNTSSGNVNQSTLDNYLQNQLKTLQHLRQN